MAARLVTTSREAVADLIWGWQLAFNARRPLAAGWLALSIFSGLAPLALLLAVRFALKGLLEVQTGWVELPKVRLLGLVLGAAVAVYLLNLVANALRARLVPRVRETVLVRLLDKVSLLPPAFFDDTQNQDLLHRARADAVAQPAMIFEASGALIQTVLFFGAILAYLALQSWVYPVLILLAAVPAAAAFVASAGLGHQSRQQDTYLQRMAAYLLWKQTDRSAVPEIRMTGVGRHLRAQHARIRARLDQGERRREQLDLLAQLAAGAGLLLSLGAGSWWLLTQYERQQLVLSDLAIGFYAFIIAHRLAGTALESAARLYRGGLFLGDLRRVLALPEAAPAVERGGASPAPVRLERGIRVENLSFRYPGSDEYVLRDVNLEIPAGRITLLTGPNGRGKSTLLKLIAGLYDPDEGQILVDGRPLSEIDPAQWRDFASVMFQDPLRFAASVRFNVELSREHTQWDIARRFGQIDDLLGALPERENTLLLKALGGHDLSGGEWQRIALARVIATQAKLMILDEPTTALDPEARQTFWDTLSVFTSGQTVLIASHDQASEATSWPAVEF